MQQKNSTYKRATLFMNQLISIGTGGNFHCFKMPPKHLLKITCVLNVIQEFEVERQNNWSFFLCYM